MKKASYAHTGATQTIVIDNSDKQVALVLGSMKFLGALGFVSMMGMMNQMVFLSMAGIFGLISLVNWMDPD